MTSFASLSMNGFAASFPGLLGCHELIQAGRFNGAPGPGAREGAKCGFIALYTLVEGIPLLPTIEPAQNDRSAVGQPLQTRDFSLHFSADGA
jgi:hypothetical protein